MKIFLSFSALFFFTISAFSQNNQTDSVTKVQVKNAVAVYDQYNEDYLPVYNGEEYLYYTFRMDGDPFFITNDFSIGWVSYNGRKYQSLPLLYDLVRNDLVVLSSDHLSRIVMHNEFIDSFSLLGHTFIALKEDHQQNLYNTGFYDLLYNGRNVQFLERHLKALNPLIVSNVIITSFPKKNRFYIHKKGLYYLVSNKKDFFRVFSDKVRELKKLMHQNHLKLKRKKFETDAPKVAALYDQLTH